VKKVLILAYDFPPYVSVGAMRPYNWYKYLHEFDVYPIVISRQWNNKHGNHLDYISPSESTETIIEESDKGTIIRTPYSPNLANRLMLKYGDSNNIFLRKAISAFYEYSQFLFLIGTKSPLYFAAKKYLKTSKVDLIIATGGPFVLFRYASILSKKFNINWIADYRDAWSHDLANQKNFCLKYWHSYFEKKIVSTSTQIITTNDFFKSKISNLIKNKKITILQNGYDPEAKDSIKDIQQKNEILSIAFIGTIYNWHPLKSFLSVVSEFISDKREVKIQINFYGINITEKLNELLLRDFPLLKKCVHIYPKMQNKMLFHELSKNNLMLLFNDYSVIGTKIYDYIGVKRTILLCYTNDSESNKLRTAYYPYEENRNYNLQEMLIAETNSGILITDSQHLLTVLGQLYNEFIKKGYIECNTKNAEEYSRKKQVERMAEIIRNI